MKLRIFYLKGWLDYIKIRIKLCKCLKRKSRDGEEADAQLRLKERDFKLQIMQIMIRQSNPHHPLPPSESHYPVHFSFNFESAEFDLNPDTTPNGL